MRVAIMVMAADAEPSTRNLKAIEETIVRYQNKIKDKLKHQYDFYFYKGCIDGCLDENVIVSKSEDYDNLTYLQIDEEESVYRTFEKTIKAFDYVDKIGYDWYVRINISMWLNIELLDSVISVMKPDCIYGNAINSIVNMNCAYYDDIYMRGDLMIFDKSVMKGVLDNALRFLYSDIRMKDRDGVDHVDDCLIGCCFIEYIGAEYYKNLYMLTYTYLPDHELKDEIKPLMYNIGTRVKTVPPNESYSGYSWDDNEYRKLDCDKMRKLTEYIEKNPYHYYGVKLKDVLVEKSKARRTLFMTVSEQSVFDVFYRFLEDKRKVGK